LREHGWIENKNIVIESRYAEGSPERLEEIAAEYDAVLGNSFTALQPDTGDITKNFLNVFWGMKPEDEPLRPEAAAIFKDRRERLQDNTFTRCLPGSIPAALLVLTFKIIQTPQEVVMLPEMATNPPRQIYTDGRPLPKNPDPPGWDIPWGAGPAIRL